MKALIKEDILIKISLTDGIEVGDIPHGVAPDRLRWNGSELIDLATLTQFYVRHLGSNYFELHAIELPNTQLVNMQYAQRKDLRTNPLTGEIYVASMVVKADEAIEEEIKLIKAGMQKFLICNQTEIFIKHFAFTAALIVFASEQPPALKAFFDSIADNIKAAFPMVRWETVLRNFAGDIKIYLESYYEALDKKDNPET